MKLTKWILVILLPIQLVFVKWCKSNTDWVEIYYSTNVYPKISSGLRYLLGKIPFSIGDIIYVIILFLIIRGLIKTIKNPKKLFAQNAIKFLSLVSFVYLIFHVLWGLNYYRNPLHQVLNIDHQYSTKELEKVTYHLLEKSNHLHFYLTKNDSIPVEIPYNKKEIFNKTISAYKHLNQEFTGIKYENISIKKSLISLPLTYMGFGGYINPFTNEAQVNSKIIKYKFPVTSCHEQAHQIGFAKENEANFIGAMACISSKDEYFKYSGYTFALRYCFHELYRRDPEKAICVLEKINPGIQENYRELRAFWAAHENPIEVVFKKFYGGYLKVNNQAGGLKSYNYVVALLVNYYKDKI